MQRRSACQQIEGLKDKADFPIANLGQLIVVHLADIDPIQLVTAGAGRIETSQQVHQSRFAGTRRAHDGDELAPLDRDAEVGQRTHPMRADAIVLAEPFGLDDGRHASAWNHKFEKHDPLPP